MANNFLSRFNIRGILAIMVIALGFYVLNDKSSTEAVRIAVMGLMGVVLGHYFGSSELNKNKKDEQNN